MSLWVLAREGAEVSRKAFVLSSIFRQNGINLYSGKPTKKSQPLSCDWDFLDISVSVKSLLLWLLIHQKEIKEGRMEGRKQGAVISFLIDFPLKLEILLEKESRSE